MQIIRASFNNEIFYAKKDGENAYPIKGEPFDNIEFDGRELKLSDLTLLPPVMPSKIVAIGKNYKAHALEMAEGIPAEPLLFIKPNTCIIANGENVVYPAISKRLDYEGELGVVIGKRCRFVSEEDAHSVIFGLCCLNDVTARDIQKSDPQWTRGKGFDTFCPIGPHIETELCGKDLAISTRLNGEVKQASRTSMMMHHIPELIAYITRCMTLLPGDIIATGTPEGIGAMNIGDTVEVEIEGIGVLRNKIIAEQ